VVDLGGKRAEATLVRHHFAGECHRHERAAVEASGEGDDGGTLAVIPRDLHRVLESLGARRQEQRLLREVSRSEHVQPLGEVHVGLVRGHVETGVREALGLLGHGRHDARVAVSGVEHADP